MKKLHWAWPWGPLAVPLAFLGRAAATRGQEARRPPDEIVRVARRTIGSAVKATGVVKPRIGAEVKVGSRVSGVVARLHVRIGDTRRARASSWPSWRRASWRRAATRPQAALAAAEATLAVRAVRPRAEAGAARGRSCCRPPTSTWPSAAGAWPSSSSGEAAANLDYARTQLGYSRITAPIAGIVASVATQEGETVAASFAAPTFVTLVDLARLEVWAYVDETDIGRDRGRARRRASPWTPTPTTSSRAA